VPHVLLAAEWCRECGFLPGATPSTVSSYWPAAACFPAGGGQQVEAAEEVQQQLGLQLRIAQVLAGAGQPLSQPRARY